MDMDASQRVYEMNDTCDDRLLNKVSKYIFFDNLWALARDLGVPETEIRELTVANITSHEKIVQASVHFAD